MKERITIWMIVALAVGVFASPAHAGLAVLLNDGATTTTVHDGDASDANPLAGVVTFSGSVGAWVVNVTTAVSKPVLGGVLDPDLDLNSVNVSSAGPGTLLVAATDTGFSLAPSWGGQAVLHSEIGGTANGSLTFTQVLDEGNQEFAALGVLSVTLGPFGPGAFSGDGYDAGLVGTPFSLTELVWITHGTGTNVTSFDAHSHVVPVPGAILLGFLGLGAAGLKLRQFA